MIDPTGSFLATLRSRLTVPVSLPFVIGSFQVFDYPEEEPSGEINKQL